MVFERHLRAGELLGHLSKLVLVIVLLTEACADNPRSEEMDSDSDTSSSTENDTDSGIDTNQHQDKIYLDPNAPLEDRVNDLLTRMSLEEKVGQMTQVERARSNGNPIPMSDLTDYFIGSVLSGGGSTPGDNWPEDWADMYDEYQRAAMATRLGIPLLYGVDAVHGHSNLKGATIFPHNIGLGAANDTDLMRHIGRITAFEVAQTGLDWTFSPCVAVSRDDHWGRNYESFSEDPTLVSMLAASLVEGYQGISLAHGETIMATAKHWLGDGGTINGIDQGNNPLSENDLRSLHMAPYVPLVEMGVGAVMVSLSKWQDDPMHGQAYWITDVLKDELGFEGIVISDWMGITQIHNNYKTCVREGINAGIDMVMLPYDYEEFIPLLIDLVEQDQVPLSRIDDAVSRILTAKFKMGLFENPLADRSLIHQIGSDDHREVARKAVRKSLVLLKNKDNILPLSKDISKIHLAGKSANNIGYQCGGWTIEWLGKSGNITEGTTILDGIKNALPDTQVTYSVDGKDAGDPDICIAVIGETPYAEWIGDILPDDPKDKDDDNKRHDLNLDAQDLSTLQNLVATGKPLIVILISGRPLTITDQLNDWDALIAAWLPGTEGDGVADVLFGDYDPTGKLSFSWPRTEAQIPINLGDDDYDPLFPFGFGLTYE